MKKIILTIALFGICAANAQTEPYLVAEYMKVLDHKDSTINVATTHMKKAVVIFWQNAVQLGITDTKTAEKNIAEINSESGLNFYGSLSDTVLTSISEMYLLKSIDEFSEVVDVYSEVVGEVFFEDSLIMISSIEQIEEAALILLSEIDYIMQKVKMEFQFLENTDEAEKINQSLALLTVYQSEAEIVKGYIDKIMSINHKIIEME